MSLTLLRIYSLALSLACLALAQDGPTQKQPSPHSAEAADDPATKISVKVDVVNVLATVRDKHGKIVNNLTKDDFTLTEDGRPQSIHYFSRETDLPLTLGLLVDTSRSQARVLDQERRASHSFLDQMVREDRDRAFIIHFDHEVELLQDLTSSHQKLEAALGSLRTAEYTQTASKGGGGGNWPGGPHGSGRHGGHHGGGTMLYDAVFLASDELMQKQDGRKALVVLSDGVDTGSKESLDAAIESAQRANTVVYSILFKDDEAYERRGGFGRPTIGFPGGGRGGQPTPRNSVLTERKSSSGSPRKPADVSSKFLKRNRLIRSIPRSPKNFAINTTSATRLIAPPAVPPAITRYRSPRRQRILLFKHGTGTTGTNEVALPKRRVGCSQRILMGSRCISQKILFLKFLR